MSDLESSILVPPVPPIRRRTQQPGPSVCPADPSTSVEETDYYFEDDLCVFTSKYLLRRGKCCESNCRHCPYGVNSGYSLIELLLTVSIVAGLAALLLPALAKCRSTAHGTQCISQVRQLGLAASQYWDEHEGIPFAYRGAPTNNGDLYWFGWIGQGTEGNRQFDPRPGVLYSYLQGRGVETCPSLRRQEAAFKSKAEGRTYAYGYNLTLSPLQGLRPNMNGLERPSDIVLFGDSGQINTFQAPASPEHPMLEEFYYLSPKERTAHFRHRGGLNAVFVDGHVDRELPLQGSIDSRMEQAMVGKLRPEVFLKPLQPQ